MPKGIRVNVGDLGGPQVTDQESSQDRNKIAVNYFGVALVGAG
jgi:hypothetical protein